ncbi:hypothetical protein C8R48DRAFT_780105 [Suillus tomentosus]|nr:hypothetical protein C8R48DRAFT_780105 [Suillus tomentosus]
MSYYAPFATTQPSWIEAMMAHVQTDRVSEFSTSGHGDDISVFWEPDSLSFTDRFTTHSPTDSTIPSPSLGNFSTLPSSLTSSPSAQPLMWLSGADASHDIYSSVSATASTNEEKRSRTSRTCHRGTPLEQSQTLKLSNGNTVDAPIAPIGQPNGQKRKKYMQAEAGRVDEGVIRARALCTTSVRQTHKRKIEDVDTKLDTDQENFDISPNPAPVETQKRICREKTGTDWQTVLDIVKYGEQWSRQSQTEDMKANI